MGAGFAERLAALIAERGISGRELARRVYCDRSYVSLLTQGKRCPSPQMAARIDELLGADGELAALAAGAVRDRAGVSLAASSVPAGLAADQGRRVTQALEAVGSDHVGGVADSVAELVDHYALSICMLPPANIYDEILAVRSYVSGITERPGFEPRRTDLVIAAGWLANLLAIAACDMGEHAAARVWCSEAERRSEDVRYPGLAAWAILTKSMIAYYQGQARHSGILASQGQASVPIGTVIHARLATQEMRSAAMAGDAARMTQVRHYAAKAIAELPPDVASAGAFSIKVGEDPPYTATSLLLVGRFGEAVSATERVIQTVYRPGARQRGEQPSGYARALLILALAEAGAGRLDEAVAAGDAALGGSRPAWPTMVLAGNLDQVLARDFTDAHQTVAYHARYWRAAGQTSHRHLQLASPPASQGS